MIQLTPGSALSVSLYPHTVYIIPCNSDKPENLETFGLGLIAHESPRRKKQAGGNAFAFCSNQLFFSLSPLPSPDTPPTALPPLRCAATATLPSFVCRVVLCFYAAG